MSDLNNIERVLQVAIALEELKEQVVFVGGSVVQFYSSDDGAANPMSTYDVDCVVDVATYREYGSFEEKLHTKNFSNDTSEGAPICRYLIHGEKVDFMPKTDTVIGKSNRWYLKGTEHRQTYEIRPGVTVFIMPVAYYLASKIEALKSRGGKDYRFAKDFEDIVYVVNSCPELIEKIKEVKDRDVEEFLTNEFAAVTKRPNIREEIECALAEENRVEYVLHRMLII